MLEYIDLWAPGIWHFLGLSALKFGIFWHFRDQEHLAFLWHFGKINLAFSAYETCQPWHKCRRIVVEIVCGNWTVSENVRGANCGSRNVRGRSHIWYCTGVQKWQDGGGVPKAHSRNDPIFKSKGERYMRCYVGRTLILLLTWLVYVYNLILRGGNINVKICLLTY